MRSTSTPSQRERFRRWAIVVKLLRSRVGPASQAWLMLAPRQHRFAPLSRHGAKDITGHKSGFTNRQMWTAHGVQVPICGHCTDRTTRELQTAPVQSVKALADLRLEPEIMFGLVR
jgi:hypothetical protein